MDSDKKFALPRSCAERQIARGKTKTYRTFNCTRDAIRDGSPKGRYQWLTLVGWFCRCGTSENRQEECVANEAYIACTLRVLEPHLLGRNVSLVLSLSLSDVLVVSVYGLHCSFPDGRAAVRLQNHVIPHVPNKYPINSTRGPCGCSQVLRCLVCRHPIRQNSLSYRIVRSY